MDHSSGFNESVTTFDEGMMHESPAAVMASESGVRITGLNVVTTGDSDDDWSVESYANDSMEIAKLRLAHLRVDHSPVALDDASSLGYGSTEIPDEDDWTVESYSNDSMVLNVRRMSLTAEQKEAQQQLQQQQQQQPKQPVHLARITRRRASMGDFVHQEQNTPVSSPVSSPVQQQQQQVQPTRSAPRRRMSMSSMSTIRSQDESLSTQGSGTSDDPAGSDSSSTKKKKKTISRHKSMPYVKPAPLGNMVPLWPENSPEQQKRTKMVRRVSNGGCPSAA